MAPSDQQLKAIFKAYDADGSGKITVEELATALNKKGGKNLSRAKVEEIVRLVDKNNDGEIDFEEFKQVVQNTASHSLAYREQASLDEVL